MRNIFKFLFASLFVVTFSCVDSENTIDTVLDYETGAILRTISVNNAVLNSSDPNSTFSVTVEEQDEADGALFAQVNVYSQLKDLTADNGNSSTDFIYVKSIPASDFETGPVGLPRGTVEMAFGEAASAMGVGPNDYAPGDVFVIGLEVELTDGRTYDWTSAAGIITGGFFSSPFKYNALLTCSPMPGTYVIDMYDSYGDGWQTGSYASGGALSVDIDGTVVDVAMCSQWGTYEFDCVASADGYYAQATVDIPVGTESATWNWFGDFYGEISMTITAPNGEVAFDTYAAGPGNISPGLLPVAVCAQ